MAVYQTDWYKLDVETQRMLLLMMIRSQRAVAIKAPFFSPSLPAFQTVGSYLNLTNSFIGLMFILDVEHHWIIYSAFEVAFLMRQNLGLSL